MGELSDEQLVHAGVPRKSWPAVRAGVTLLLSEKALGLSMPSSSPFAAKTRHSAKRRAKAAEANAAVAEAAAALAAAAVPSVAAAAAAAVQKATGVDALTTQRDDELDAAGDPAEIAEFAVTEAETPMRLDRMLSERFPLQSRTYFASLCAQGLVTVDGAALAKGAKLAAGAVVSVQFQPTAEMEARPERMELEVLHEDEHLLVLNKAAGVVVHPAPGNWAGTLVNGVLYHLAAQHARATDPALLAGALDELALGQGARTSTVVHRLDKGTTGAIVFAKSAEAQRALSELFRLRKVRKSYLAVCVGDPGEAPVEIALPIGRDRANRLAMTIVPEADGGRAARSVVRKLACDGRFSLAQVDIFTGRTHQIRVHMRAQGLPILGDEEYGSRQWNQVALKRLGVRRPLLHAHRLAFEHPFTGEQLEFEAPLPEDLARAAAWIRSSPAAEAARAMAEGEDSAGSAGPDGDGGFATLPSAAGDAVLFAGGEAVELGARMDGAVSSVAPTVRTF